jgi:flagellum-specific peptidoglycan hydrolase FlgJ
VSTFVGTRKEMIEKYGPFVKEVTRGTGIFPGTVFSQMVTESSGKINGKNLVGGSLLTRKSNNFFGIKGFKGSWSGPVYRIDTGEQHADGSPYTHKNAAFRAYPGVEESIKDYLKLITNKRYSSFGVNTAPNVHEQFVRLKKAGYMTSTGYVNLATAVYEGLKKDIDAIPEVTPGQKKNGIVALVLLGGLYYFLDNQYNITSKVLKKIKTL